VQRARWLRVVDVPALAGQQRRVLPAGNRLSDEAHGYRLSGVRMLKYPAFRTSDQIMIADT
jgi:hypothetical protein